MRAYRSNYPGRRHRRGDVWNLDGAKLPLGQLAWASFPCQDLSLAGGRRGLNAPRSGAFWGFWNVIEKQRDRAPKTIVIENVAGLLSSHDGRDFTTLLTQFADAGYRVGAMLIDAAMFSPQSRQRLFIVAHKGKLPAPMIDARWSRSGLSPADACAPLSTPCRIQTHMAWVWWRLPYPPRRNADLASLLERDPPEHVWRSEDAHAEADGADGAAASPARGGCALPIRSGMPALCSAAFALRKTNACSAPRSAMTAWLAALRTPAGGSSKQLLLVTENGRPRLRPMMAREAARLMGLEDSYRLPPGETKALKVIGDGVSVPVVRWLGEHLLSPLAGSAAAKAAA
jgi:DNA (cytosine-5)-methyltransferase 1